MAGWQIVLHAVALCLVGVDAYSDAGKYLVTAPENALPGSAYSLTVQVFGAVSPVNVSAYLEGYNGYDTHLHQHIYLAVTPVVSISVLSGSVQTLTIQVPENVHSLTTGSQYRLHIRGFGGLQIEETYSVSIAQHIASIFIQTDKATYAPGETVTFKTFGFQLKDLTPYTKDYSVTLKAGNVVFNTWTSISGQAINTFHFDLDTHTITGTWTVTTSSTDTGVTQQTFTVEPQPKEITIEPASGNGGINSGGVTIESSAIEVKVHLPKTMNASTNLIGSFEATYPVGVGIKGTADITLNSGMAMTTTIQFNGSGSFQFSYKALYFADTRVTVRVKDEETGMVGEGEANVAVYERDIKIQFTEQTPAVYKPKLPFTAYIKITNNADEPLHIPPDSVYSTVHVYGVGSYIRQVSGAGYRSSTYSGTYPILARKVTLPDSGLLSLDLDIPEDVISVDLVVTFQGVQKKLTLQQAQHSEGDSYLQIYLMGSVPAVTHTQNADVKFRVLSSQPFSDLTVEMVSRGKIVSAVQPALTNKGTSGDAHTAEISVTLTWEMTPVTEVIAYHVVEKNHAVREVVSDSMMLNVEGLLEDTISVTSDTGQQVTPGQEVTLTVHTRPGAHIGILVEESNAGTNQVLSPESVTSKIQQSSLQPLNEAMATSSKYATGSFALAHLLLMSGGALTRSQQTTPVKQTAYSEQKHSDKPHTVYLGTNTTGVHGITTFAVTLPERVTTWAVTGFVFDDTGHVSVVDQPLQIEAVYEVYGELLGPDRVISGEQVVLTAYVHNARRSESQVSVTLRPKANVQTLHISANSTFQASSLDQQQTLMVPAKNSKQVLFTVISPVGTPLYTSTAEVELLISSGSSTQTVLYSYTVAPKGVEKTVTFGDVTRVDGHANTALTGSQSHPKEALPQTVTSRVAVQEKFSDLLLPLVLAERDVMAEGTELSALLHFGLPVLLAQYRPDAAPQLKGPIGRAYQRLMAYLSKHESTYSYTVAYPGSASFSDWLDMTSMRMMAEAKRHIYVNDAKITSLLFKYFYFNSANNTIIRPEMLHTANKVMTTQALEAYYSMAIQNLPTYVNVYGHKTNGMENYELILRRNGNFLREDCVSPPVTDPLSLSYLALACVRYGVSPGVIMPTLMARKNASSDASVLFWSTSPKDDFNYLGDWMPGHHVAESTDLVIAANVLQVLVLSGQQPADAERVARWLFRQRNGNGLFKTAWDTLAATEALLVYDSRPGANTSQVHLNGRITSQNTSQWEHGGRPAHFSASGHGVVFSQVEVQYHVTSNVGDSPYEVVPVVLDESLRHFKLMVCNRWLLTSTGSGVTVQRVALPSGFRAHTSHLSTQSGVTRLVQNGQSDFTLYFSQIERDSSCYTVTADRVGNVAHTSPGHIYTSSFSKPEYQDITMYQTRRLSNSIVCDLCSSCCP